ncbi:hypothetical protein IAQ61_011538 [Plenodomus lingam]|uniref:Predicted protein n=1 Tax=Leptosphaeria maculans (strain JN3 / isolate v23.1.3 / race Av1-4-5-6-7-8) TaxID=985895 RepID=E5AAD5_LEPMJ|nr:predicted protein [Plenodomus lingam JN3]KAH9859757.1 hypothetical protein IAQ61_011538 [Plenodomus lingam]CBY00626.1 predicted protein [Plenodomus lingam JN3]
MPGRTRPIDKLATAAAKCSKEACLFHPSDESTFMPYSKWLETHWNTEFNTRQGSLYGKCIFADYNNVYKDKCAAEFKMLKDCYLKAYKQR